MRNKTYLDDLIYFENQIDSGAQANGLVPIDKLLMGDPEPTSRSMNGSFCLKKVTSQMTVQESSPLSDSGGRDYHYSLLNYASEGNLPKVQQTVEKILASS